MKRRQTRTDREEYLELTREYEKVQYEYEKTRSKKLFKRMKELLDSRVGLKERIRSEGQLKGL